MSETKFTKGPLKKTDSGIRSPGGYICFFNKTHHFTGKDERYEQECEEREANMDLFAAAPDLYAALRLVYDSLPWYSGGEPTEYKAARLALAKARGEKTDEQ